MNEETKGNKEIIPFWTFSKENKPFFDSVEQMQEKILEYFQTWHRRVKMYDKRSEMMIEVPKITISWLVLYLGFCNRKSFYTYEAKDAYSHTIKRARTFIEMTYEEQLSNGNVTGAIFALKNFGWKDTQTFEGELNNNWKMTVEYVEADHSNYDKDWKKIDTEEAPTPSDDSNTKE